MRRSSKRCARIQPLINGTGILIHTNLGRAPLGPAVVEALTTIAANYNNLEYDLSGGERGARAAYLEAWDANHKLVPSGDDKVTVEVGRTGFVMPIPIVKEAAGWRFDIDAGRTIGRAVAALALKGSLK